MNKPQFVNIRTYHEFSFYKKIIWKLFGRKIVELLPDGGILIAYVFKNITYVDRCDVYE